MRRSSVTKTLSDKLRSIRYWKQMSQSEILSIVFPDADPDMRSMVSLWEKGKREPRRQILIRYARLAEVSLEDLLIDERKLPSHISGYGSLSKHSYRKKSGRRKNKVNDQKSNQPEEVCEDSSNDQNPSTPNPNLNTNKENEFSEKDEVLEESKLSADDKLPKEDEASKEDELPEEELSEEIDDDKATSPRPATRKEETKTGETICRNCCRSDAGESAKEKIWDISEKNPYGRESEKICVNITGSILDDLHEMFLQIQLKMPRHKRKYMSLPIIFEISLIKILHDYFTNDEDSSIYEIMEDTIMLERAK